MESDRTAAVQPAQRTRDLDRLLTFVDAVVAIAITLLVLPLVGLSSGLGEASVATLMRDHFPEILAFVISFYVIANLWFDQHRVLHSVVREQAGVTTLLICWTFTVVVLPFPTSLVAEAGSQLTTKIFYLGTMAVSSGLLTLLCRQIGRHPEVRDPGEAPDPALPAVSTAIYLLVLVLSLLIPGASYWPLVLLRFTGWTARRWRRWRPLRSETGTARPRAAS